MRATNVLQRPTSNDQRTATRELRQALAGYVRAARNALRAEIPEAHVPTRLALYNKPMVATATVGLDREPRSPGRRHIGQPFGSSGDGAAIGREEIEESHDFVPPRGR